MKPVRAHFVSASFLAAALILAPAVPVFAQADSATTTSAPKETQNSASASESTKSIPSHKHAGTTNHQKNAAEHQKKKKPSFAHKMRDKALAKMQKFFGSKQGPKEDSKQE
jgi:dienelactone hydrolase